MPKILFGSMPNDGGNLILETQSDVDKVLAVNPSDKIFIKKMLGAEEFLNGKQRWCLWVDESNKDDALSNEEIKKRVDAVREYRLGSKRAATQKLAKYPYRFGEVRYKPTDLIIIPEVSSERREYIPMGFLTSDTIVTNRGFVIYDVEPWLFALLETKVHTCWIRTTCGTLGMSFNYSSSLGYNAFPAPPLSQKQKEELSNSAMNILMARENHTEMTLAQMYDPDKMPEDLRKAHNENDILVEHLYQNKIFQSDEERLAKLFAMYEELTKDK
jgi:hypothetical protein